MCGGDEHVVKEECVVLHKEHLAEHDPTLTEVFDLPPGWEAERENATAPWKRAAFDDEGAPDSD